MTSFPDIDECSTGGNACQRYTATCTNVIGSYTCACKEGYTGDGRQCVGLYMQFVDSFSSFTSWARNSVYLHLTLFQFCKFSYLDYA